MFRFRWWFGDGLGRSNGDGRSAKSSLLPLSGTRATWCLRPNAVTRISPDSLRSQFKRLLRKAELPFIPFRSLRHTAISLMAHARVPLGEVQQIVGHKRVATTLEIYTHYAPNDLREAVNHISERLTRSA